MKPAIMSFDVSLLNGVLVCTHCRARLIRDQALLICTNDDCRLAFEIRDEIPNMLIEEARTLPLEDWSAARGRNVSRATAEPTG